MLCALVVFWEYIYKHLDQFMDHRHRHALVAFLRVAFDEDLGYCANARSARVGYME